MRGAAAGDARSLARTRAHERRSGRGRAREKNTGPARSRVVVRAGFLTALVAVMLAVGTTASATAATLSERTLAAVRASAAAPITSVFVWDQTGTATIASVDADRAVAPASTMKLLTSAATMARFGPDHRFTTRLALTGHQTGDTWVGDVWLVGGGDPSLSTFGFARRNYDGHGANLAGLVAPLRRRGITTVTGQVRVDDDWFDALRYVPEWKATFRYDEAGALGALTVNQSRVGSTIDSDSVRAPDLRAGEVFRDLASRQGIRIVRGVAAGSTPDTATWVGVLQSPTVAELLDHMNATSDNFFAETLLKGIGADRFGPGASTSDGRRAARSVLGRLGIDLSPVRWLDGSGLAYGNRVTARSLGGLMRVAGSSTWGERWIASFAHGGQAGSTLEHRLTRWPYRSRIAAKTGTLVHVSALAGFSTRLTSGRSYGFVVLTFNPGGRPVNYASARALQDRLAMILVR